MSTKQKRHELRNRETAATLVDGNLLKCPLNMESISTYY